MNKKELDKLYKLSSSDLNNLLLAFKLAEGLGYTPEELILSFWNNYKVTVSHTTIDLSFLRIGFKYFITKGLSGRYDLHSHKESPLYETSASPKTFIFDHSNINNVIKKLVNIIKDSYDW